MTPTDHNVHAGADEALVVITVARLRGLLLAESYMLGIRDRGCQNSTQPWDCTTGRVFDSRYGFNQMCDPCRAHLLVGGDGSES